MAASCGRRALRLPSASAAALLSACSRSSSSAARASKLGAFSSAKPSPATRFSLQKLAFSRTPVELGGAHSLMPLHSVTASALFTSLLSLSTTNWGCLSEEFATPL